LRGFVRTAAALALIATGAAFHVLPARAALLGPVRASDPRLSPRLRALVDQISKQRLEAWRSFPHVITRGDVDWSKSAAARRIGQPAWTERATFKNAIARKHADVSGPPAVHNIAFFRVDFLHDRDGTASTGDGHFNLDPADTNANPVDRPPHNRSFYLAHHEALARYYDAQSYGRVKIVGDVWPHDQNGVYHCSDMADFGPWRFNHDIAGAAVAMMHVMLDSIEVQSKASGDTIPWHSITDIVIIHAGSDLQSDLRGDSKLDIPSFTLGVGDSDAVRFPDGANTGVPIDRCTFVPETQNQDGFFGTLNGVLAHECGHLQFGFADLYDFNTALPVVGLFSLMDSGNLAGSIVRLANGDSIFATGLLPPSIDPFHKSFMTDAIDFPEVQYGPIDSLRDIERHPEMHVLTQSSDEIVVLENRFLSGTYSDSVQLEQDSTTHVVLGPKKPDRFEYDALLPGGGILMWHIDTSVIPLTTSLRPNPDFGVNTNRARLGVSIYEADGLGDIGDPGSPFILGSYRDPWYVGNNTYIDDHTRPRLVSNSGTLSHASITVLDTLKNVMRYRAARDWRIPGWPVITRGQFPPGGPQLLAIDLDGDHKLEVCWAGGDTASGDSSSVMAYRSDGTGLGSGVITTLPRRPLPVLAALPTGGTRPQDGPSLLAVTTMLEGTPQPGDDTGEVWLVDHTGFTPPGWPLTPAGTRATTPPVFAGDAPSAALIVGAADGHLYAYNLDGSLRAKSDAALGGAITGRLAVWRVISVGTLGGEPSYFVAAGSSAGDVATFVLTTPTTGPATLTRQPGWPQTVSRRAGFTPDFLWMDFDGVGGAAGNPSGCTVGEPELVVHDADRLWAFCAEGRALPGWGRSFGDTIVAGLGAGDPDGDGFPEVLIQTQPSKVAFVNLDGAPSPGWPKPGSPEGVLVADSLLTGEHVNERFPSQSPPLAIDLDGSGRPAVVALNVSGIIAALRVSGGTPDGWPLATGSGVSGAPLAADLDGDGKLELVAPDRFGVLYGYALPVSATGGTATPWTMLGGDPERTSSLPASRTSVAPAPTAGPIVPGTIKVFPNPARRRPVTIAYTLTEPARVDVRVLNTAGEEVASFGRDAGIAENVDTWNPGSAPAGLYVVHVRIRSAHAEVSKAMPVGVIK